MKRYILSLLTLVMCVVIGFAQSEVDPFPTAVMFSSPDGTIQYDSETGDAYLEVSQMNTTVYITLDKVPEVVGVSPVVMLSSGVQYGFNASVSTVEMPAIVDNTIVITLDKSNWGRPIYNNYYITMTLAYLDADGDIIERDGEPITFFMPCVTPNTNPAEYVYAIPDDTWAGNYSFADAYRQDFMTVAFNNEIVFDNPNDIGTIRYYFTDGYDWDEVAISEYISDWNRLDYYWALRFPISDPDFTADDIERIEVELNGVKSYNSSGELVDVDVPIITLLNNTLPMQSPRKKQSRIEESLKDSDAPITIYNIQGMAVKENVDRSAINDLPAGLYIINGKKVLVK